ncbi:MAG: cohesin domain-containing protein [Faecalicatena sp.]|uniref:cohesin domain-containing protein n=1 Tax=Faecalicatena sp. TaxID=2005360 RepID=UPI00258FD7EF|nr:cohesin domain-containing protein [Faecalicatena sp.]MCI6465899.1 cohesin domain-containing protein [Faecalicatena sp.]MDY5618685.1 cohesin domain-containing protein [Lachnospiraceae bacterium]
MERLIKRAGAVLLAFCLTISCFSIKAYAAEGTLQFSDPSAAAGDKVTVKTKVNAGGAAIGDVDVTVTYDASILRFESGTNATGGDGTVQLSYKGDGTAQEAEFTMEFTALKEGTTKLQASEYTAYLFNDESLNLSAGDSTVTIQGGTPVTDTDGEKDGGGKKASSGGIQVEVDGKSYTVNENFTEAAVPKGFTAVDTELDGKATKAMLQETSGQYMYYLEDSEGNSDYFLYSTDDGSFSATEAIDVNSELSIYLMDHKDSEGLPSEYDETTIKIGDKVFAAWNNTTDTTYYLVYALSSAGTKGYYQYDETEQTYQRYTVPAVQKEEKAAGGFTGKVMNLIEKHLIVIMCVVWGVILLLLIVIIVLAVKLSHRNQEIDELYDEYGLDDGEDSNMPRVKNKSRDQFIGFDDDDDYEVDDDDFAEDDYDDEYDDDGEDFEDYEDDDDFEDYDDDDDFEDYDDDDFFDEDYEEEPVRKSRKSKKDDDYSVDFIDI